MIKSNLTKNLIVATILIGSTNPLKGAEPQRSRLRSFLMSLPIIKHIQDWRKENRVQALNEIIKHFQENNRQLQVIDAHEEQNLPGLPPEARLANLLTLQQKATCADTDAAQAYTNLPLSYGISFNQAALDAGWDKIVRKRDAQHLNIYLWSKMIPEPIKDANGEIIDGHLIQNPSPTPLTPSDFTKLMMQGRAHEIRVIIQSGKKKIKRSIDFHKYYGIRSDIIETSPKTVEPLLNFKCIAIHGCWYTPREIMDIVPKQQTRAFLLTQQRRNQPLLPDLGNIVAEYTGVSTLPR